MVLSKAKKRAAFQPGSLVIVKKSNLKGKIIDTIGRKKWKVELTLDGQTTVADYTSQQLRHPKDHELQDDSSNTSNTSNVWSPATTSEEQTPATTSDKQTGVEPGLVNTTVPHEDLAQARMIMIFYHSWTSLVTMTMTMKGPTFRTLTTPMMIFLHPIHVS